jgi:hypothetical protein
VRDSVSVAFAALAAALLLTSCAGDEKSTQNSSNVSTDTRVAHLTIPSGTSIEVAVNTTISSETAKVGDVWNGTMITERDGLPAGSVVNGTVTAAKPAQRGDRARLELGLGSITVKGDKALAQGGAEAIIAGSTRARNLGADGYQVVLKSGTPLTFTTSAAMAVRQ